MSETGYTGPISGAPAPHHRPDFEAPWPTQATGFRPASTEGNTLGRSGLLFALSAGILALLGIPSLLLRYLTDAEFSGRTLAGAAIVDAGVPLGLAIIAIALGVAGRQAAKAGQATNNGVATTAVSIGWVVIAYALVFRLAIGLIIAHFVGSGAAGDALGGLLNFLFAVPY